MNQQALKLIKHFEGCSLVPYGCPGGYKTIGWGHRILQNECFGSLTEKEVEALLQKDLRNCERVLAGLVEVPLAAYREAALLSFVFNVGGAAFQRSRVRMKVNREEHHEVGDELKRWVWCRGQKLPGLIKRRQIEAAVYGG